MGSMPYHAIAVGMDRPNGYPNFQILLLIRIRIIGAALITTAAGMEILFFIPFWQGMPWVRWSIPAVRIVAGWPRLYVTIAVKMHTPATAPWMEIVVFILLLFAGIMMSSGVNPTDSEGIKKN